MPKVWNKRDPNVPKDAIYVGRPSKWGNPFTHLNSTIAEKKVATREEAVEAYRKYALGRYIDHNDTFALELRELEGKDLVCWCAPKLCHADVLMELANA